MSKVTDRQAIDSWEILKKSIFSATTVDNTETAIDQAKRIARLEADDEAWFKFFFPNYCYAEPAPFHIAATRRIMKNPEWYEARAWSRELAKDARTMMEILKLTLTGKKRFVIFVSNSYDNAVRLLTPYKINLESNQRIIHDYGKQEKLGAWEAGEFTTTSGVCFRAVGAGQSPRGARNEEVRPDVLIISDIDTDADCENPDIIEKRWDWCERALIGTRSISKPLLVIFLGNIIAEDCCMVRAMKKADHASTVNLRTNGKSSWPQKNSEEQCDRVINQISWAASQAEHFNNPITQGKTFKDPKFGRVPLLSKFKYLVLYGDPSPSERETKKNSFKTMWLVGEYDMNFYVIKGFLEQTTNSTFITWYYDIKDYVHGRAQIINYIENNTLQDPFYQQVFKPLFLKKGRETGHLIPIKPDERKKPDKYTRIEGTLEPINRMGRLIFNEDEQNDPHMQRLIKQFKAVSPKNKNFIDGPDAVEGAVWILNNGNHNPAKNMRSGKYRKNNKRSM